MEAFETPLSDLMIMGWVLSQVGLYGPPSINLLLAMFELALRLAWKWQAEVKWLSSSRRRSNLEEEISDWKCF